MDVNESTNFSQPALSEPHISQASLAVVFQYFYWPYASKITTYLPVSANLLTFLIPSVLHRGEILSSNTLSEAFTNQRKMSLLTAKAYWDTHSTKPFQDILCIFCLLSRTVFEILCYLLRTSWLLIITG